jgi:nitroreductase
VQIAFRQESFLFAARSIGLDCSPLSGFNNEAVDKLYFSDGRTQSNFLCGIGYGDMSGVWPRLPRPEFDQVCTVV